MDGVFTADPALCTGCGLCAEDCVAGIIGLGLDGIARVVDADQCIGCQHCLAVCPEAAVTVRGLSPAGSASLRGFRPDADNVDLLVRGRRSVRRFAPDPVPPALLERILNTVSYAPTGVNARQRRFTVVHDATVMKDFRERVCRLVVESAPRLPEEHSWLAEMARDWLDGGGDAIFRDAPHLLVTSVDRASPCADVDAVIAASYFDFVAQANGVGTVWAGMIDHVLKAMPETRDWLGIPERHVVGYAVLFGMPGVQYSRTAQYGPEEVVMVSELR